MNVAGAERRWESSRATWFVGCAVAVIVFVAGSWWTASTGAYQHVWADASWIGVDLFALATCVQTARRARRSVRVAWWSFSIAIGCWNLAMILWTYYELVLGRLTPFPSLVDVLTWIGSPFFVAGIFFYKDRDRTRVLGLQQLADLALTVAAIVALTVTVLYVPAIDARYPLSYVASALATPMVAITGGTFGLLTLWQHVRARAAACSP